MTWGVRPQGLWCDAKYLSMRPNRNRQRRENIFRGDQAARRFQMFPEALVSRTRLCSGKYSWIRWEGLGSPRLRPTRSLLEFRKLYLSLYLRISLIRLGGNLFGIGTGIAAAGHFDRPHRPCKNHLGPLPLLCHCSIVWLQWS